MKILSIEVKAFGKLKNYQLTLSDKVNLFYNVNGFGKTTLANFIRSMFYGLNYTYHNVENDRVNDVVRFAPWNSDEKFGGSLTFEHDGSTYKIERFFGKTQKAEELSVFCLETNKKLDVENVGEYFLGLSAESFDRSAYYPQESVSLASNDNFNQKLAGLVENEADSENAIRILKEARKKFKYERGKGGLLDDTDTQINNALLAVSTAQNEEKTIRANSEKLISLATRKKEIQAERESLGARLNKLNAEALANQGDEKVREQMRQLQLQISSCPATITIDYDKAKDVSAKLSSLEKQQPATSRKGVGSPVFILLDVLTLGCAGLAFVNKIFAYLAVLFAVVCVVLFAIDKKQSKKQAGESASIQAERERLQKEFDVITSQYGVFDSRESALVAIQQMRIDRQSNVATLSALQQMLHGGADNTAEIAELSEKIERLDSEYNDSCRVEGELTTQNATLSTHKSAVELEDEVKRLTEQKVKYARQYQVLNTAIDLIGQAKENLSTSYLPRLGRRATELLQQVTGKNLSLQTDKDFVVALCCDGLTKGLSNFSRGTRETALLCFRVALSEMLFDGSIPLLVIDDAFVNYDEETFANAVKLVKDLAKGGTQIVYFTCHERGKNAFGK